MCRNGGNCHPFGSGGKKSYCGTGAWQDPDSSNAFCTASGCGFVWLAGAGKCCGDDPGEDLKQVGVSNSCCYNGSVLVHGASSGSILCFDGELFDCGGGVTDDSGLSTHKGPNEYVGNYEYTCAITNNWCARGYADCDGSPGNGCERLLDNNAGACGDNDLGTVDGDNNSGAFCSDHCVLHSMQTGWGEKWYEIYVKESSSCCADVTLGVTLNIPANVDYDINIYSPCATLKETGATNGLGVDEQIYYYNIDSCGDENDGFTAYIHVSYWRGVGCGDWNLQVYGGWGCF